MDAAGWILLAFLACFAAELAIEGTLLAVNLRRAAAGRGVPPALRGHLAADVADRSRAYVLANGRFSAVALAVGAAVTLVALFSGLLPALDRWLGARLGGAHLFVAYLVVLSVAGGVVSLPLAAWRTFVLEARFGFNRTTPRLWIADRLKALALQAALGLPLLYAVYGFMRFTGGLWWLWLFGFLTAFQLLMTWIWPAFIAPLFNEFSPLPEGPLRARLAALAAEAGFTHRGLYVMDASKRSGHSNAYFTGLFRPRIVLFDTLVQQMTVDEAASVLAHEIGHYRRHHVHRMLAVSLVVSLFVLWVLSLLVPWAPLYAAFGFGGPSLHAALALGSLTGGAFTFWLSPLASALSRRHEYEADRYAVGLARAPEALASALVRLAGENLSNPDPHPWYSAWHYSHPTLAERLAALRQAAVGPHQARAGASP